jgi:hypothetical protein
LRRRSKRARIEEVVEEALKCESGDEVRVRGEVVWVDEVEEAEERVGEKAVRRRRREGVRRGWKRVWVRILIDAWCIRFGSGIS